MLFALIQVSAHVPSACVCVCVWHNFTKHSILHSRCNAHWCHQEKTRNHLEKKLSQEQTALRHSWRLKKLSDSRGASCKTLSSGSNVYAMCHINTLTSTYTHRHPPILTHTHTSIQRHAHVHSITHARAIVAGHINSCSSSASAQPNVTLWSRVVTTPDLHPLWPGPLVTKMIFSQFLNNVENVEITLKWCMST